MGKPNLDGHWWGLYVVSRALRDAGMEVVYSGYSTPAEIVKSAVQEDVDIIGLSLHSCDNIMIVSEIMELVKKEGVEGDVKVIVGGTLVDPEREIKEIRALGVDAVFPPESPLEDIVGYVYKSVQQRRNAILKYE